MRTTRALACVAVGALASVLGACGDDDDTSTEDGSTTTVEATTAPPEGLVSDGAATACSDTPYPPFEMEGEDGEQTGFDMELMRAVAEDAGLELAVIDLPFDGILGAMAAGQCDLIASAVSIKPERLEQVDFTEPYFESGQSIMVRAEDADTYATLADLAGERIGAQSTTTGETYANENKPEGAEVVSFEDADGLFGALLSGDIAAVLQDYPVNAYRTTEDDAFVVTERFETNEVYAFAVEKGDAAMLAFLNEGLDRLREDGRFDEIFEQFFGESG